MFGLDGRIYYHAMFFRPNFVREWERETDDARKITKLIRPIVDEKGSHAEERIMKIVDSIK